MRPTSRTALVALALAAVTAVGGCSALDGMTSGGSAASPTSASPAPSASARPSGTPEPSASPSDVVTPTPSATPSATPTPSASPTPTPSTTPTPTPKPRTTLQYGDAGPRVLALQQRLSGLGYWLGTPDGHFGSLTQQAVWALQKSAGLARDGVVGPNTMRALDRKVLPRTSLSGNGVEISIDRQVLMVVRGGRVTLVLNTSTGSGERYTSTYGTEAIARTPRGRYQVLRAVDGQVTNSLGSLWRPIFFRQNGIAVHGSPSIPPWPASHGCARVSNPAVDMIWAKGLMPLGSTVLVS